MLPDSCHYRQGQKIWAILGLSSGSSVSAPRRKISVPAETLIERIPPILPDSCHCRQGQKIWTILGFLTGSSVSAPRRKISVPAETLIERGMPTELLMVGSIFSNKKKFGQSWAILGNLGQGDFFI